MSAVTDDEFVPSLGDILKELQKGPVTIDLFEIPIDLSFARLLQMVPVLVPESLPATLAAKRARLKSLKELPTWDLLTGFQRGRHFLAYAILMKKAG